MSITVKGLDKLERNLRDLQRRARALDGTHGVPLNDLLSPAFMRRHTRFSSFEAMLDASPWTVETAKDFLAMPDEPWDHFVRGNTPFKGWKDMQAAGGREWASDKLGF